MLRLRFATLAVAASLSLVGGCCPLARIHDWREERLARLAHTGCCCEGSVSTFNGPMLPDFGPAGGGATSPNGMPELMTPPPVSPQVSSDSISGFPLAKVSTARYAQRRIHPSTKSDAWEREST